MSNNETQSLGILEAQSFGLSPSDVGELLNKYGPTVLSIVSSALKNGFSLPFVMECLRLFGPTVLDFIVSLWKTKEEKPKGLVGEQQEPFSELGNVIQSDPEIATLFKDLDIKGLNPKLISVIFEKLLPFLIQKYGPQLLDAVIKAIEEWTSKEQTKESVKL
jgi:hypothetical protein